MLTVYHNPRCSKSRESLAFLEKAKINFDTINYLDNPPTMEQLKSILKKLKISPIELVRKNERIWKDNYKDIQMNDEAILQAMHENPNLIERPIIVNGEKAIIARPSEKINNLL